MSTPTKEAIKVREILKQFSPGIDPLKVACKTKGGIGRGKAKEGRLNIARNIWK